MRSALQNVIQKRLNVSEANGKMVSKVDRIKKERSIIQARHIAKRQRQFNAAATIQALYRQVKAKELANELRIRLRACTKIQSVFRMVFAQKEVHEELMKRIRVVPTASMLKLLRKRCGGLKRRKTDSKWVELLDPWTDQVFYVNLQTLESRWDPPKEWNDMFACTWMDCDEKFTNHKELSDHLLVHRWTCEACLTDHGVDVYPQCPVCGNEMASDGRSLRHIKEEFDDQRMAQRHQLAKENEAKARRKNLEDTLNRRASAQNKRFVKSIKPANQTGMMNEKLQPNNPSTNADDISTGIDRSEPERQMIVNSLNEPNVSRVKHTLLDDPLSGGSGKEVSVGMISKMLGDTSDAYRLKKQELDENTIKWRNYMSDEEFKKANEMKELLAQLRADLHAFDIRIERLKQAMKQSMSDVLESYQDRIRNGFGRRVQPDGAVYQGMLRNGQLHGQGEMVWPNGDRYVGFWKGVRHGVGIHTAANGTVYEGHWDNGTRHGYGILTLQSGQKYVGDWERGHMHGNGVMSCANGDKYEGQWKKSRYHGACVFTKKSGDVFNGICKEGRVCGLGVSISFMGEEYRGEWEADVRHGRGTCTYPDGSKYTGMWRANKYDDFGELKMADGGVYSGSWSLGKRCGKGTQKFGNADIYVGQWENDLPEGEGIFRGLTSGDVYEGHWVEGQRQGHGILKFRSGCKYEGAFHHNCMHGIGTYVWPSGDVYKGMYRDNKRNGKGSYVWVNGNTFSGDWKNDTVHGFGEFTSIAGHRYKGEWRKNRKHGNGTLYYSNGDLYIGSFKNDKRTGEGTMIFRPDSNISEKYTGDFENGIRHGFGLYVYADDSSYKGYWKNGQQHGRGLYKYADGSTYEGNFHNDYKHGKGRWENGPVSYDGEWSYDIWHGEATLNDGTSIFTGTFVNGVKHGVGIVKYKNGDQFEGKWNQGQKDTRGKFIHRDGMRMKVFAF
eukprot:TRINITY_DN4727_c0_g1_i1.p1 TRINITY_DN4727_c0_g1~~TRINITY_DN4727_c0_g1_i1.p1  ORF type:complete len:951 (-),score=164.84 TRINITY_DN4727_c0_g1_i1:71-2923(-)